MSEPTSYQNSLPGQLYHDEGMRVIHQGTNASATGNRRIFRSVATVGVAFLLFVAFLGRVPDNGNTVRAGGFERNEAALLQQQQPASSTLALAEVASGKAPVDTSDMPQPDYNGEGRYDWQKCKDSNDPDCWKNEGERVGGYWHNFGQRTKTFWMNFRKRIHNFFGGKNKDEATDEEEVDAVTTKKKKHKKKDDTPAAAAAETGVNAMVAP